MTIYNFNKGIGWASSGVEYAQAYRSNIFRKNHQRAKFIFTDVFHENLEPLIKNIGFKDDEIIWLYQYFTDIKISPTIYTLEQFEAQFSVAPSKVEKTLERVNYIFEKEHFRFTAFLDPYSKGLCVYKSELIIHEKLVQRDYYNYTKIYSEYFKPVKQNANLYQRRFFNEDGSVAYEELLNGKQSLYIFKDRTIYSFEQLLTYFVKQLKLTKKDILIMDRATGLGPSILKEKGKAKLGVVIHAEHFNEPLTDCHHILWNNFYDYQFKNAKSIDFFITATETQKVMIETQFQDYGKGNIKIYAIPVGSMDRINVNRASSSYSLMTASRLAGEKHIDWLIQAVSQAKQTLPELTLDIYGQGGQFMTLKKLIDDRGAQDYIHLMGQQDLTNVYPDYATYVAASTSEGFGLTLLEAVNSGLGLIGFNVRYGNQTFIKEGKNGRLVTYEKSKKAQNVAGLCQAIIQFHQRTSAQFEEVKNSSYQIARPFLTENVQKLWLELEEEVLHDSTL